MPLPQRVVTPAELYTDDSLANDPSFAKVIPGANATKYIGVMHQLAAVAEHCREVFDNLHELSARIDTRIESLSVRVTGLAAGVGRTERSMLAANLNVPQNVTVETKLKSGRPTLNFKPDTRPLAIVDAYEACAPLPRFDLLDPFSAEVPCSNRYSDPRFFEDSYMQTLARNEAAALEQREERRRARQKRKEESGRSKAQGKTTADRRHRASRVAVTPEEREHTREKLRQRRKQAGGVRVNRNQSVSHTPGRSVLPTTEQETNVVVPEQKRDDYVERHTTMASRGPRVALASQPSYTPSPTPTPTAPPRETSSYAAAGAAAGGAAGGAAGSASEPAVPPRDAGSAAPAPAAATAAASDDAGESAAGPVRRRQNANLLAGIRTFDATQLKSAQTEDEAPAASAAAAASAAPAAGGGGGGSRPPPRPALNSGLLAGIQGFDSSKLKKAAAAPAPAASTPAKQPDQQDEMINRLAAFRSRLMAGARSDSESDSESDYSDDD